MKCKLLSAIVLTLIVVLLSSFSFQLNNKKFEIIKWDGKELTFKAVDDVPLKDISVVAGTIEYKTTFLSNTSGNLKFPSGSILTPGSSFRGFADRIFIVLKETTVECKFDDISGKASKVYFYIDDGSKIEVNL